MKESKLKLAVIYADYTSALSYYDDWLEAFTTSHLFIVNAINCVKVSQANMKLAIKNCDAIILLHSTNGDTCFYIEPFIEILANRQVPMLTFVGNEVNLPGSPIAEKRILFKKLKPEFIATQLLKEAGDYLFADCAIKRIVPIPHALNEKKFKPNKDHHTRQIDIGTRAVKYIPHIGDKERNNLHRFFHDNQDKWGLNIDISNERLNREGWRNFLNNCKGTVSSEAGSWFIERDDVTVNLIRSNVLKSQSSKYIIKNDSILRKLGHKMPIFIKNKVQALLQNSPIQHELYLNESINADEIIEKYFKNKPKAPVYSKAISSRHFDAIGTKTTQILHEGRYNDILEKDSHYISLKLDYSNIEETLALFKDEAHAKKTRDLAYEHCLEFHTYNNRMQFIHALFNLS